MPQQLRREKTVLYRLAQDSDGFLRIAQLRQNMRQAILEVPVVRINLS
jgi:hypothetical protein